MTDSFQDIAKELWDFYVSEDDPACIPFDEVAKMSLQADWIWTLGVGNGNVALAELRQKRLQNAFGGDPNTSARRTDPDTSRDTMKGSAGKARIGGLIGHLLLLDESYVDTERDTIQRDVGIVCATRKITLPRRLPGLNESQVHVLHDLQFAVDGGRPSVYMHHSITHGLRWLRDHQVVFDSHYKRPGVSGMDVVRDGDLYWTWNKHTAIIYSPFHQTSLPKPPHCPECDGDTADSISGTNAFGVHKNARECVKALKARVLTLEQSA